MNVFPNRLRQRRNEQKMSQDDVAKLMGKAHRTVVSSWESGKSEPTISELYKLAEVLATTPAWLLGDDASSVVAEPPAGYVLMPAHEVIEMQRRLIQQQDGELERQK